LIKLVIFWGDGLSKYRDRLQIIADILVIVGKRAKKTQIMYQANLSYRLLCRYLTEVLNANLASFENGDSYVLTEKGKEFLSRHSEYSKWCKSLEKHLNHISNKKITLEKMCFNANKVNNNVNKTIQNKGLKKVMR